MENLQFLKTYIKCFPNHYLPDLFFYAILQVKIVPFPLCFFPGIYYSSSTLPAGGGSGSGSPSKLQRLGSSSDTAGYSTTQRLPSSSSSSPKQSPANRLAKSYR